MIGGEATIDYLNARVAELEQERDQLAAHVEVLRSELKRSISFLHCHFPSTDKDAVHASAKQLLALSPTTSLARRDLIKQAEALEDALLVNCNKGKSLRKEISHRARNLRQQAEALK